MSSAFAFARIACVTVVLGSAALAQQPAAVVAPASAHVQKVWHLGRVTGDLPRIIDFYHGVLGLNLRGARSPLPFSSSPAINEFVNAPAHAEFRAAFMPIQGTSADTVPADQIYLEAFEYRNIDRRQILPPLSSPGASSLRLLVRDLDTTIAAVKTAGASIITPGGVPIAVPAPAGFPGSARAVMVRDPDGYPVELMAISPAPATPAPADSPILGAHMTVVVTDLTASLNFYRQLAVPELPATVPAWQKDAAFTQLRNIREAEYRTASIRLPGSAIVLDLVEFRGFEKAQYLPTFQDIGHGHVAFIVKDIQATVERMKALNAGSLSKAGTWTQINASTRAVYTRDPDGFFLEILERR